MSGPMLVYSSLSEFLQSTEGKSFDEAKDDIQAEYATVSRYVEDIRRARKTGNASRVSPEVSLYLEDLLRLVNAMEGHDFAFDGVSDSTWQQIESALKDWGQKK
jgi:hypothetical protein